MSQPESVFVVSFRRSIWRVTLDGVFFGDYRSKQNALKGVHEARMARDVGGRRSSVVMGVIESA